MTETTAEQAPPPPPPPPPRPPAPPLVRPATDRVLRGVCVALGRSTGTDPVLWRVLLVVLAVFGGTGLVLYLAGWLLIPEEGQARSTGQRLLSGQDRSPLVVVLVAVAAVLLFLAVLGDGRGLVPLAVVGLIAYLVVRERDRQSAPPAATWSTPPAWEGSPAAGGAGGWGAPPGPLYGPAPPPPPPAPPTPRSPLGALTLSAVALVVGALLLAGALGADGITASRVLAAALLVTGAGLLVGARWGRARGLIVLAVVLALALSATTSADRAFGTETGERRWVTGGPASYELAAGEAVLDLRPLSGAGRTVPVEARIGAGELVVLVPDDVELALDAEVALGELVVDDAEPGVTVEGGAGLERVQVLEGPGRRVELEVRVGVGELEVRRVPSA